jgi:hypothetical protein
MNKYNKYHEIMNGVLFKKCNTCEEWFEANSENFKIDKKAKSGFNGKCIGCQKEYNREAYLKHQEERRSKATQYYFDNKEIASLNKKKWYIENGESVRLKRKQRYHENSDYDKKYLSEWQKKNPNKIKEYRINRQHKKHTMKNSEWLSCKEYFNYRCAYCGISEQEHKKEYGSQLHRDHYDHEGSGDLSNCIAGCMSCNSSKRQYNFEEWFTEDKSFYDIHRKEMILKWINGEYRLFMEQ